MTDLSIAEIKDWRTFEDLVAAYFKQVKEDEEFNVDSVDVQQTGIGSDGGRDILVTLTVDDSIKVFKRIWVVQCKFHEHAIGKSDLADINIPSLIHEYGANGYLLVCKHDISSTLSGAFENYNKNCKFGYRYEFWNQNNLFGRIRLREELITSFFPLHAQYLKSQEEKKLKEA